MKRSCFAVALASLIVALVVGCDAFRDPTPRNIAFEMRGGAGKQVRLIYSKQFIVAVTEGGVTQVQVVRSDTVVHALPFDTIIDISIEKRWFAQAEPIGSDTLDVTVIVDVDDRNLVNESGGVFPEIPWRFAYSFNHRLSRALDVEF